MIKRMPIIALAQWALIGLMSACGALAFSHSNTGTWLQERLAAHYPVVSAYLPWMVWGLLFLAGFCLVILARSSGKFSWLVVLFASPSLLSFSSINILKIIYVNWPLTTTLSFMQALVSGLTIITCYLLLNYVGMVKLEQNSLKKRGAEIEDIESINTGSHLWLLAVIIGAVLIVTVIALLSTALSSLVYSHFSELTWNLVLAALICVMILALYLYWLGLRRKSD